MNLGDEEAGRRPRSLSKIHEILCLSRRARAVGECVYEEFFPERRPEKRP